MNETQQNIPVWPDPNNKDATVTARKLIELTRQMWVKMANMDAKINELKASLQNLEEELDNHVNQ